MKIQCLSYVIMMKALIDIVIFQKFGEKYIFFGVFFITPEVFLWWMDEMSCFFLSTLALL